MRHASPSVLPGVVVAAMAGGASAWAGVPTRAAASTTTAAVIPLRRIHQIEANRFLCGNTEFRYTDSVVIPVHDVNPVRRTPWVTYLLIAVNVGVFLLTPAARDTGMSTVPLAELCRQEAFYDRYAAIPREMTENRQLPAVPDGVAGVGPRGPGCVVRPPGYHKIPVLSVLYSMFLHGGWLHLLGNMLFLWVFGNNVEDRLGRLRFLVFYLLCGYVAAYGFALVNADATDPLIGASGATAGVPGAYLMFFPRARVWSLVP